MNVPLALFAKQKKRDKDAVALTDAASSILRTNRNLKGKSIQKKQRSGRQTGIIPFAAKKTKETDK